ncbi:MAG: hypothetical protein HQ591_09070 [candidate division Zixibacteria bacterium]|nr:hypothetical protein [Candidatus Tariuqbacter arcticus]
MEDVRIQLAKRLIDIDNPEIISIIYEKSFELLKMELDRHNRIVEKGRNYLSMCLVLIGIILASVNFIFRDSSLVNTIPNWTLTTILMTPLI